MVLNEGSQAKLVLMAAGDEYARRFAAAKTDSEKSSVTRSMFSLAAGPIERTLLKAVIPWALYGFPSITLGARHAASLIATRMPAEHLDAVRMPWKTFWLNIPNDLIFFPAKGDPSAPAEGRGLTGVIVHARSKDNPHDFSLVVTDRDHWLGHATFSPAQLAREELDGAIVEPVDAETHETRSSSTLGPEHEPMKRAFSAVGRLIVGAALEMTEQHPGATSGNGTSQKRNRRGEPLCRDFVLVRDVRVDCRQVVRAWIAGETARSPAVQSLVHGHWKWQPYGPEASLRKWIHVEPYWRGPEDGPVAVRDHVLSECHRGST